MGRKARASKVDLISRRLSSLEALPDNSLPLPVLLQESAAEGISQSGTSHSAKKRLKTPTAIVRRSPRIQNTVQDLAPIIEEIIVCESKKDDEPVVHEEIKFTEEASDETSSSKKGDPGVADAKYKTMYISSQKKIEALLEENKLLSKTLELANGKIHMYEKQSDLYSEVMGIIGSLSRVNENLAARVKLGAPGDDDNEEFEGRDSKKRMGA